MDNFRVWINAQGGIDAAAEVIGVSRYALVKWLARKWSPRLEHAAEIYKASKGKVTPVDLLAATTTLSKKVARK